MNEAVAEALRQALASRTDVRLAILFGSAARVTDRDVFAAKLAELEDRRLLRKRTPCGR